MAGPAAVTIVGLAGAPRRAPPRRSGRDPGDGRSRGPRRSRAAPCGSARRRTPSARRSSTATCRSCRQRRRRASSSRSRATRSSSSPGGCATSPQPASRVLLTGMHTCANCHSFSRDGKTLGLDLDGPQNDKGVYALADVQPMTTIRNENVVAWSSFRSKLGNQLRVGFMSQVSPDGRHVVTTILPRPGGPTGSRATCRSRSSFSSRSTTSRTSRTTASCRSSTRRAGSSSGTTATTRPAQAAAGRRRPALRAGELDLEPRRQVPRLRAAPRRRTRRRRTGRWPRSRTTRTRSRSSTTSTASRGTRAAAARPSRCAGPRTNGMSNSFPKISPDGKWIVFVQAKNGLLMRPDSKL